MSNWMKAKLPEFETSCIELKKDVKKVLYKSPRELNVLEGRR